VSADHSDLFTPLTVGSLNCKNRVVMALLTRSRAGPGNVPNALNALYYAQRASAGLIISEATQSRPRARVIFLHRAFTAPSKSKAGEL
jgi:N-ethylmaleimide reductase